MKHVTFDGKPGFLLVLDARTLRCHGEHALHLNKACVQAIRVVQALHAPSSVNEDGPQEYRRVRSQAHAAHTYRRS